MSERREDAPYVETQEGLTPQKDFGGPNNIPAEMIERMRAEWLAEQDAKHKKELAERDAKHKKELAELDAKHKKEKEALQTENKTLNENASIQAMLKAHGGLPPLEINQDAKPSATKDATKDDKPPAAKDDKEVVTSKLNKRSRRSAEEDQELQEKPPAKKASSIHEIASRFPLTPSFAAAVKRLPMNFCDENGHLLKSALASYIGTEWQGAKLENFNEASPAMWMNLVVRDVLKCLNIERHTHVAMEVSFGCLRPDILVVRHRRQIILILEVKNGGDEGAQVVGWKVAVGQQYDYAMMARQMGIDVPFVVLTTYHHLQVGTLQPDVTMILQEALKRLNKGNGKVAIEAPPNKDKPDVSPGKEMKAMFLLPNDGMVQSTADNEAGCDSDDEGIDDDDIDDDDKNKKDERVVYATDTFDTKSMFEVVYLSLVCGIVAVESTKGTDQVLVPRENDTFKGKYARVRGQTAFTFTAHSAECATYELKVRWRKDQTLYFHAVLGIGNTGKVHLMSDTSGRMFAAKLFPFDSKIAESYSAARNLEAKEAQREKLETMRDEEAGIWKKIYPEYAKAVYPGELLGVPCLMMPFVASIPKDRRRELIRDVKAELLRAAAGTRNEKGELVDRYVYAKKDLRWRHIGLRNGRDGEERIVLVDLGSMTELKTDADENTIIHNHIKELWKRAAEEEEQIPQGLIGGTPRQD